LSLQEARWVELLGVGEVLRVPMRRVWGAHDLQ
jgi:hypothetical protein